MRHIGIQTKKKIASVQSEKKIKMSALKYGKEIKQ